MRILWDDALQTLTLLASSEAPNLPAANLQDPRLSLPWRSTGDSDEWIKIDAGAGNTLNPNCAAIAGHNLSSGATIKIQGNATDVWTAPTVDETITWRAGAMMHFFTGSGLRFWRFHFSDASNPDGYVQIGRLSLGTYLQMPDIEPGPTLPRRTSTVVSESLTGQVYADLGIEWGEFGIVFPAIITEAQRQAIRTMWAAVHNAVPFFLAVWESSFDVEGPVYCRLDQDELQWALEPGAGVLWSTALKFKEVF